MKLDQIRMIKSISINKFDIVDQFPVDVKSFANLILDWCDQIGVSVTPMKLQKLIYYCHADFLMTFGIPLVSEEFEAWDYGPVSRSVYQEFKKFSGCSISTRAEKFDPVTAKKETAPIVNLGKSSDFVKEIFRIYSRISATDLSRMSHVSDGPWSEALVLFRQGENVGRRISNELIRSHHRASCIDRLH